MTMALTNGTSSSAPSGAYLYRQQRDSPAAVWHYLVHGTEGLAGHGPHGLSPLELVIA